MTKLLDGALFVGTFAGSTPPRIMAIAGVGVVVFQVDAEPILIDQNTVAMRKLVAGSITPEDIEKARVDLAVFGSSTLALEFADYGTDGS